MSVIDASVLVNALVDAGASGDAARASLAREPLLQAPAILKAEAVSAVRSLEARGNVASARAAAAVDQIRRLFVRSYPIEPFMGRVWQLRPTLSVYDAWYVALAEELGATLATADRRLAGAPGLRCEVDIVE